MLRNFLWALVGIVSTVFIGIVYFVIWYVRKALDWER